MKRVQHKLTIERKVIDVSQKLFLEKGYDKTTIKEITEQAGITTGSLYHFFRDKEDILSYITKDMFDAAVAISDEILEKESNPWLRFSIEIGIQFYFVLTHRPIAELYLAAHQSGNIARLITQSAQVRNQDIFKISHPHLSKEDYYVKSLAVKGIIHSFVQEVVHGKEDIDPSLILRAVEMTLLIFQIPTTEMDKTIQATHDIINKKFKDLHNAIDIRSRNRHK